MLSNRRLVATCAIFLCCNTALLVIFVKYNASEICYVNINIQHGNIVGLSEKFLSFGIDASLIKEENRIDFTNPKLRQLAAELAPAHMRLGGTMSDRLIFSKDGLPSVDCEERYSDSKNICLAMKHCCYNRDFFIMSGKKWTEINEFCKATNIKLLFSINVLLRIDNVFYDENAIELISFSKKNGFDIDWQLGNEPNSFHHVFNISISPQKLAHDFKHLRELLDLYGYSNSLLVGPDTTRPQPNRPECLQYMVEFLGNASHSINAISWHQYYLNSKTATLEDFWNPNTFDLLNQQILAMRMNTHNYTNMPMWLSETSSSYGGGAPGLSNSFAGSPLWLDKLGLASKHNISTVIRQSFSGGNYSLIDMSTIEPLPDWWISVLYKKLVGNKVLNLHCNCSQFQRLYVHCTNRNYTTDNTAITIYAINLEFKTVRLNLNGTAFNDENLSIDEFILRPPSNNRKSKKVLLNGWQLNYDSKLPSIKPVHLKYGRTITMPPYSIAFWVVKKTSLEICK